MGNIGTKNIPLTDFEEDLGLSLTNIGHSNSMNFGCKAYKHVDKEDPKRVISEKFNARAVIYWFVGF